MDATKTIVLALRGPVTAADVPELCDELTARLRDAGATEAICDVGALTPPNLATVNALARLQLTARGQGCRIRLRGAGPELRLLLDLVGLADTVQADDHPGTEAGTDTDTDSDPPHLLPGATPSPGAPADRTAGTSAPCPGTS